jgi:uncharacterized protein (TIGR00730 family)
MRKGGKREMNESEKGQTSPDGRGAEPWPARPLRPGNPGGFSALCQSSSRRPSAWRRSAGGVDLRQRRTSARFALLQLTERIARLLSDAGFSVISGGGPGIMEAANKGAFSASRRGRPQHPAAARAAGQPLPGHLADLPPLLRAQVHVRRFASAYVVMPGGFGTLDELLEALTLIQTGKSRKIPLILVCSVLGGLIDWFKDTAGQRGHDRSRGHRPDPGDRRAGSRWSRPSSSTTSASVRALRPRDDAAWNREHKEIHACSKTRYSRGIRINGKLYMIKVTPAVGKPTIWSTIRATAISSSRHHPGPDQAADVDLRSW